MNYIQTTSLHLLNKISSWLYKWFKLSIGLLLIIILLFFTTAFVSSRITATKELKEDKDITIYLSTNGVHVDYVFKKDDLDSSFLMKIQKLEDSPYAAFGWGDKLFYLETPNWKDLKLKNGFKALFLNTPTAMHVTEYPKQRSKWYPVVISKNQLSIIMQHIIQSFDKDAEGDFVRLVSPGYTKYDAFYEANNSYNCIHTCNEWVNRGLRKASIKTSIWAPFDWGVLRHFEKDATQ